MEPSFSDTTDIFQITSTLNAESLHHPETFNHLRKSCESCRALKLKCELLPEITSTTPKKRACRRCVRNNQECVFVERTQRRRKRSDTRLAELEKKVDFISSFASSSSGAAAVSSDNAYRDREYENAQDEDRKRVRTCPTVPKTLVSGNIIQATNAAFEEQSAPYASHVGSVQNGYKNDLPPTDAVDKGILSMRAATILYNHYNMEMVQHFPAVVNPPRMTASTCRTEKPTLFLAIITAAAATSAPNFDEALQDELYRTLAEKVMYQGEKSLTLIQAMLISTTWCFHSRGIFRSRTQLFAQQAAVMARILGLASNVTWYRPSQTEAKSIEARRTFLACYWVNCNISIMLQGPLFLRFTPYMSECIDLLETSPDAAPTDKAFVEYVKIIKNVEEVHVATRPLSGDFEGLALSHSSSIDFVLSALSRKLAAPKARIALIEGMSNAKIDALASLLIYYHSTLLQIYSIGLRLNRGYLSILANLNPPDIEFSSPLTASQSESYAKCVSAAHTVLDTFLSLSAETVRSTHAPTYLSVVQACTWLIQVYVMLRETSVREENELARTLRVTEYLEGVIRKMTESLAECRCKTLALPLLVLKGMRRFFDSKFGRQGSTFSSSRASERAQKKDAEPTVQPSATSTTTGPAIPPTTTEESEGWNETMNPPIPYGSASSEDLNMDYWPWEAGDKDLLIEMGISEADIENFALSSGSVESWMLFD